MKKVAMISLFACLLLYCLWTPTVAYSVQTIEYEVGAGETGHQIAYKFMDRQDKYDDVREFWFYIEKDSNLNRKEPLQVGQKLTINLYKRKLL